MVHFHSRTRCKSLVLLACEVSFSTVCFLNGVYPTLIISSNGPGDVNKRPLLPRFWAWRHTKVVIHFVPLGSSHISKLKQQSNGTVPRTRRVYCPNCHVLTNCNRATTQDNLHHVFYMCPYFSIIIL
jgi:hypothetical protein